MENLNKFVAPTVGVGNGKQNEATDIGCKTSIYSTHKRPSFLKVETSPEPESPINRRSRLTEVRRPTIDVDTRIRQLQQIHRIELVYRDFIPHFFIVKEPAGPFTPDVTCYDFFGEETDWDDIKFSVSPPLIPEMQIDSLTGVISGTPMRYSDACSYTITCRAMKQEEDEDPVTMGQTSMTLNISIVSPLTGMLWRNPHKFITSGAGRGKGGKRNVLKGLNQRPLRQKPPSPRNKSPSPRNRPGRRGQTRVSSSPTPSETPRAGTKSLDTNEVFPFKLTSMFQPILPACGAAGSLLLGFHCS